MVKDINDIQSQKEIEAVTAEAKHAMERLAMHPDFTNYCDRLKAMRDEELLVLAAQTTWEKTLVAKGRYGIL